MFHRHKEFAILQAQMEALEHDWCFSVRQTVAGFYGVYMGAYDDAIYVALRRKI